MYNFDEIKQPVINMLKTNMGLQKGEKVLVLNDVPNLADWQMPVGEITDVAERSLMVRNIYDILKEEFKENQVDYLVYGSVGRNGMEPPEEVAKKMLQYDVVIAITSFSISHTIARENANKMGARIASMPGLEHYMLLPDGPINADCHLIAANTVKFADMLTASSVARITTAEGTDISFSLENRDGRADTGLIAQKGDFGNLPGGEAYAAPLEGTANGRMVVPAGWHCNLRDDMEIEFQDGYAVSVKGGGEVGAKFSEMLSFGDESKKHRRNCAELGIGTNHQATRPDCTLEAEKIVGTVHIALGDSAHFGGITHSDVHQDFILPKPTLYLDHKIVIKDGEWC